MASFEELNKKYISAVNSHDVEAIAAFYAKDCVIHDPFYPEPLKGRDAAKKDFADFLKGFPDVRFEFRNELEKGDVGAAEVHFSGTNTGPMVLPTGEEMPPTRKRIDAWGGTFVRVNRDGLIVEERRYYDTAAFMRQLGIMPEPALAGAAR